MINLLGAEDNKVVESLVEEENLAESLAEEEIRVESLAESLAVVEIQHLAVVDSRLAENFHKDSLLDIVDHLSDLKQSHRQNIINYGEITIIKKPCSNSKFKCALVNIKVIRYRFCITE
jgi:hypothetical protein